MSLGVEDKATALNSITDDIKEKFPECMSHTMVFISNGSGDFDIGSMLTFANSANTATVVQSDIENFEWVFVKNISPAISPLEVGESFTGGGSGTITKYETIQDVIDDCILLKILNIVTLSLDKLRSLFADMFSGMKNYSSPCGADKLLEGTDIGDGQKGYMKLVNKLQSGDIFDDAHTKLQEAYMSEVDDCYGLYEKLASICSSLDGLTDLINQVLAALKKFEDLLDKMLQILGVIGAILGCGEEILSTFGQEAPWLSELNSDMGTTLDAVTEAKEVTSTPAATMQYAKQKASTDLGIDIDAIDRKNELLNLGELF